MTRTAKPKPTSRAPAAPEEALEAVLKRAQTALNLVLTPEQRIVRHGETLRQWCGRLAGEGLKVDGRPFSLETRPAMAWVYDQIPSTREECFRNQLTMMKCAQVGFTTMEILAAIYLGLKFGPITVGMFLPDQNLAQSKSAKRFEPIAQSIPALCMEGASKPRKPRGSLTRRQIAGSEFVFGWTSGASQTESTPMDVLAFDEVQNMDLARMEAASERLSASSVRYKMMGSTANLPGLDIHHHFLRGTQHEFHTRCPDCGKERPLADYFPGCIKWDDECPDEQTGEPGAYRYVCEDGHWIDDPQSGEWKPNNPKARTTSIHFPQMLSPTISPGEIMEKYNTYTDKKGFYNRVLGKPWIDPSQRPVTMEAINRCVEAAKVHGVIWKKSSQGSFMGIDQMGQYNVVVIKELMEDNRRAIVHMEEIFSDDPFARCAELIRQYNVKICVVEQLPNYNDAKRFATRNPRVVFLCDGYGALADDMLRWGDRPGLSASDRRTTEEARDRFTVRIDQAKAMAWSLGLISDLEVPTLIPEPKDLVQDVLFKGAWRKACPAERAFEHWLNTAIISDRDPNTNRLKRLVKGLGLDPHYSFANLLCDVAMARAIGTTSFILPQKPKPAQLAWANGDWDFAQALALVQTLRDLGPPPGDVCGACFSCPRDDTHGMAKKWICPENGLNVLAEQPGCWQFVRAA